jgi:hypothetical protein
VLRKACLGNRTDMQRQVRFQYPTDTEVRYLDHLPEIGDHVSSSLGDAFVVEEVRHDGAGWVVVAGREGAHVQWVRSSSDEAAPAD